MHTEPLTAATTPTTQHPKPKHSLTTLSKPSRTALRLIVTFTVLLGLGFITWGMLRAEFDETFHTVPGCHRAAPYHTA